MPSAIVQATGARPGAEDLSLAVTFASSTASGRLLVACVYTYRVGGALPTFTVSDNKSNTYSAVASTRRAVTVGSDAFGVEIFAAANAAGGAAHEVTVLGSAASFLALSILEVSGADLSSPTDAGNNATGTSTTPSSGAITLAAGADLVIGSVLHLGGVPGPTVAPGTGLTEAYDGGDVESEVKTGASGSQTATWTLSGSAQWAANVASFKAAAGGGTILPQLMQHYYAGGA